MIYEDDVGSVSLGTHPQNRKKKKKKKKWLPRSRWSEKGKALTVFHQYSSETETQGVFLEITLAPHARPHLPREV